MLRFDGRSPESGSAAFAQWLEDHEHGFFVNVHTSRKGVLHHSRCHHSFRPLPNANLVSRAKLTARTRDELVEATRELGMDLRGCKHCLV